MKVTGLAAVAVFAAAVAVSVALWTWLLMVCLGAAGVDWGFWHVLLPWGIIATVVLGGAQARMVRK